VGLEAVELAQREPPRTTVHTILVDVDTGAEMAAADTLMPDQSHVVGGLYG
jgi:hypothetical protein